MIRGHSSIIGTSRPTNPTCLCFISIRHRKSARRHRQEEDSHLVPRRECEASISAVIPDYLTEPVVRLLEKRAEMEYNYTHRDSLLSGGANDSGYHPTSS